MAVFPRPVTMMIWSQPAASASSTPYWMIGLSTRGSISLGWALVAGRKRVPNPAAGNTALNFRLHASTPTSWDSDSTPEPRTRSQRWAVVSQHGFANDFQRYGPLLHEPVVKLQQAELVAFQLA